MTATNVTRVDLRGVSIGFETRNGIVPVLNNVSVSVARGRTLGIVGESGSGKTTLARALMGGLPEEARVLGGEISVDGRDILRLNARQLREWHRTELAVVHQEAGATLDPSMRIGSQLAEILALQNVPRRERRNRVRELLEGVRLPDPEAIGRRYPHELSGGQQQRVVIAAALATRPSLIILDEPTSGLDASVEADILSLLADLRTRFDAAVVLISHDLGIVSRLCDDVAVLYAGRVVEFGAAASVLSAPQHPYTAALLNALPQFGVPRSVQTLATIPGAPPPNAFTSTSCSFAERCAYADSLCRTVQPADREIAGRRLRCHHSEVLHLGVPNPRPPELVAQLPTTGGMGAPRLRVEGLTRGYGSRTVLTDIDLDVAPGEIFGLVGESGSGKTSLARAVMGIGPTNGDGSITLDGVRLSKGLRKRPIDVQRKLQMVFQQPDFTLNPSHRVRTVLERALRTLRGTETPEGLAARVWLDPTLLSSPSRVLSGGQKQRVAIARALAGAPSLVVADESVSALDASVQAGILEVIASQRDTDDTSYLFISHDLAVVGYLADRVGVMHSGRLIEVGATQDVLDGPQHPYTASLIDAATATHTGLVHAAPHTGARLRRRLPVRGPLPPVSRGSLHHTDASYEEHRRNASCAAHGSLPPPG